MKKTNLLKVVLAVALLLSCVCFTGCDLVKGAIGGIINSGGLDFGGGSSDCQHENYVGRQQAPTCTEDGADMRLCVNCGKVLEKTTIPALGHDYVDGVCTRCGKEEDNDCEHTNVSDWIIDKEANCKEEGSKHKECIDCGAKTETAGIKRTADHTASDWVIEKEATCTESGSKYNYCTVCSEKLKTETINALGHNYVGGVCTRCGAKENVSGDTYTREGNYIYFGSYPQTKVTDSATLNALSSYKGTLPTNSNNQSWTNCKYYINGYKSSFMWYKDVSYSGNKYRAVYFTSYRPNRCCFSSSIDYAPQAYNGYNTGTVYWFKYEPIKWRILTEDNGSAFLMSEIAIDSQQYYHTKSGARTINGKTVYENNYAESEIRAWLNETFYNTAFSSVQKSLIKTTLVDNSAASTSPNNEQWDNEVNQYTCEDTNDKIFLLSYNDVTNSAYGFSSDFSEYDTKRQLKSTDYANSQGCSSSTNSSYLGNCLWWLRSPDYNYSIDARSVDSDGSAHYYSYVDYTNRGVVPALWINL